MSIQSHPFPCRAVAFPRTITIPDKGSYRVLDNFAEEISKTEYYSERAIYWWGRLHVLYGRIMSENPPTVRWNNRLGTRGGTAFPGSHRIELNPAFAVAEPGFDATVAHEVAHIFACRYLKSKGHDRPWQECMRQMGFPANRCHQYASAVARRNSVRRHPYHCPCGAIHMLTPNKVTRMRKGSRYMCLKCKRPVNLANHCIAMS